MLVFHQEQGIPMIHFGREYKLDDYESKVKPMIVGDSNPSAVAFFESMKALGEIDQIELLFQEVLELGIKFGQNHQDRKS
ncbi:MAG: hypothetical protein A3I97_00040 [Candidatus Taylorbacteria bacterium RIFCSPLOWO2_02_FULL_44_35]|nr:MAG: hypothetical protein A3I97_00040 [Candidatus Taylorbacteria bacterium RIFCSPLOWO2_02_FULL_44_35]